jgi:hypothetical protein
MVSYHFYNDYAVHYSQQYIVNEFRLYYAPLYQVSQASISGSHRERDGVLPCDS